MDCESDIPGNQERDTKADEINIGTTDQEFSNNATTTELVNKPVDPKEIASVEQTDKSAIEARTEEVMHDVEKSFDAPTAQVNMTIEIKCGLNSDSVGIELASQSFSRSEHLEVKHIRREK